MPRKEWGQRQSQHMPHRNIKEYQEKPDADPKAGTLPTGGFRRGLGGAAARGTSTVARRGDGGADLGFRKPAVIIIHQHTVLHQIDIDGGDPRQRRDRPLHMGAARGTAHAGHIKTLFHRTPPLRYILRHYYKKGGAQSQQQFCPKKGNIPAKAAQNNTDFARRTENVLNFYKRFYSIFAEFVKGRQILIEMTGDRLYNIIARAGNDSSSKRKRNNL